MQTQNHVQESHIVVSTDAARQGVTGHNVRYVLGFGLFGIVVVFALLGTLAAYGWLGPG